MIGKSDMENSMTIADYSKNSYFAAANSRDGFVSFFDDIFSQKELDFLYIIKGGSGSGKSRLMREIAAFAQERGESVEYFYCSADPRSLDGIILTERKIGIIDGTAPHVCEPRLPGCFDEILNLGAFWDSRILKTHRDKIRELCAEKSRLYSCAYSYLCVAGKLASMCDSLVSPYVKSEKLAKWAQRFCMRYAPSDTYVEKTRLTSGISSAGRTCLDSFYLSADKHFIVSDSVHIAPLVFDALKNAASLKGISMCVSYDPLDTKKINALYFTDHKISITLADEKRGMTQDTLINTERFFERESYKNIRQKVRFMSKCSSVMCDSAIEVMKEISKLHASVEDIYISAMNFEGKEAYTKALADRIFNK